MSKVVVIGIDGGSLELLRPWIDEGQLPVIGSLMSAGAWGNLESTRPPVTCPAWWSFSTGKNPGHFGAYHFCQLAPDGYEINSCRSYGPGNNLELWDILGQAGFRCGIINNPIMATPQQLDGYSVAGFLHTDTSSPWAYPAAMQQTIDAIADGYEIEPRSRGGEPFAEACLRSLNKRKRLFCHLLAQADRPDFFLGIFTESDRMCHRYVNLLSSGPAEAKAAAATLLRFFRELDGALGEIMATLKQSDFLFVISDHGFGPRSHGFYINEWLEQEGYLTLHKGSATSYYSAALLSRAAQISRKVCQQFGLTDILKDLMPASLHQRLAAVDDGDEGDGIPIQNFIASGQVDWGRTSAISLSDGLIYINNENRRHGIVPASQYDNFRDELVAKLIRLNADSGEALETEVWKKEQIYHGQFLDRAPDLNLVIDNYQVASYSRIRRGNPDGFLGSLSLAGHRLEGMLLAKGPGVKAGELIQNARLIDLAPTILALMGLPVPADMDGRTLSELFKAEAQPATSKSRPWQQPVSQAAVDLPTDSKEEEKLSSLLEDLGYL